MYKALRWLAIFITVCVLSASASAADHSAELFLQLGHSDSVTAVAFSPDGTTLASGSDDTTIKLWDVLTRQLLATLDDHSDSVSAVAFSPDGKMLASGSDDTTIKLWDVASQKLLATLDGHSSSVNAVAFTPDGKMLASGSDDTTIKLWDVASQKLLATPPDGYSSSVNAVAFSPDGKTLVSGDNNGKLKLWDVGSQKLLATLDGHSSSVNAVAFSSDGKTLASGGSRENMLELWDVPTQTLLATLDGHSSSVSAVAFSPDGKTLASGSWDTTLKLWNVTERKLLATLEGHSSSVNAVAFAPDNKTLVSGSNDTTLKLWDVAERKLLATLEGHSISVNAVAFSPDGKTLASGSNDTTLKLWDDASRQLLATLEGHSSFVNAVAFSPDGKTLASGSADRTLKLWDVASQKLLATLDGQGSGVSDIAFSPDGKMLASGGYDNTLKLWDMVEHQLLATLEGHSNGVSAVAFSPDGKMLASGGYDNTLKLWDMVEHQLLATLEGHSNGVSAVAFSPDGKTLASGSGVILTITPYSSSFDFTTRDEIKLWDMATHKLLTTLEGHSSGVRAVTFSPDGKTLASGSDDRTLKLWDMAEHQLLATLEGHSSGVSAVAFNPDGKTLASGSDDNTLIQWDGKSGEIITRIVLLPGNQWLVYHPRKLVYHSSYPEGQEEKYAAIRFDGQLRPVYPLQYYRQELKRENGLLAALRAPQPVIEPKWFRLWWDTSENKGAWFTALVFGVVIGFVVFSAWHRRSDPLEIAKQFFEQTGAQIIESLRGRGLLLQASGNRTADLVALWPEAQDNPQALVTAIVEKYRAKLQGRAKLYLVYKERGPESALLQALRTQTGCDIIPLFSTMLEQAVLTGDSTRVLRDLEEPYLIRTDPYAESKPVLDPQWFYGRGELLQRLPSILAQGQHVGLFGLRKVGKTSLINQLRQRFVATPTVFIDCQAWPAKAESYFTEILQQLQKGLSAQGVKDLPIPPTTVDADQFRRQFLAYFDGWQKTGRREPFLLVLDEIDKFFPHRDAKDSEEILTEYVRCFRILRGLAQTRQCLVLMVVAYRPDINRHDLLTRQIGENPMAHSFQEEVIGFLNAEESTAMIQEIGTWKDIVWEHDAARRVFDYCGGHPLLTRWFASEACKKGSRKNVDLARVEDVATEQQHTFDKNQIGQYYKESVWNYLRNEEQSVLSHICQNAQGETETAIHANGSAYREALTNLERLDLVTKHEDMVRLRGALFEAWMKERMGI